jgi:hypothetical protein
VFKDLTALGSMWRQAQQLGGRMKELTEELRVRRVTGSAGGGLVEIEVNGLIEVVRCRIDPALLAQQDRELLEDLIATATNQAVGKAKQLHAEAMRSLTGGMQLPGLEKLIGRFLQPGSTPDPEQPPPS